MGRSQITSVRTLYNHCIRHDRFHYSSLLACPDASRHRLTFRSVLAVSHVSFPILASHSFLGSVNFVFSCPFVINVRESLVQWCSLLKSKTDIEKKKLAALIFLFPNFPKDMIKNMK